MKRQIFYFSGTGNSLSIAKGIMENLGEGEIIPITKYLGEDVVKVEGDEIGIIYPCYCATTPRVVKEFLKKLIISKNTYVYVIVTHNNVPGNSGIDANKILGGRIDYYDTVLMPGNSIILEDRTNPIEEVNRRLENSKKRVTEISENIKKGYNGIKKVEESFSQLVLGKVNDFVLNKVYKVNKKFWTNEKCNGCGACSRVCPMKNIEMKDKNVVWNNSCESCLACYHWCPQNAIELSTYTKDRVRRTNPNIKRNEMVL